MWLSKGGAYWRPNLLRVRVNQTPIARIGQDSQELGIT